MERSNNYIVTAANWKYFNCFYQLYLSIKRTDEFRNSQLICFDLGFKESQKQYIEDHMSSSWLSLRRFDFERYPDFVKNELSIYAWKPIIIKRVLDESKGSVLWMDSANMVLRQLSTIWSTIESSGSYIPVSGSGSLKRWSHPNTLKYLDTPIHLYDASNRAGNTCGFSYCYSAIMNIVADWQKFTLIYECNQPKGADRTNHRWDQSILSILLAKNQDQGQLEMTTDEVDISSKKPNKYISVRNIINQRFPLFLVPWIHFFFRIRRAIDILLNRMKG